MSIKCQTVINYIEQLAPKYLAEEWDNVGLQVGKMSAEIKNVLVALDINKEVVKEALEKEVDLIITHHPLFFKPMKNLCFDTPFGSLIETLVKNNISVYSAHTNLDSAEFGVNTVLAKKIGLKELEVLNPDKETILVKLVVFVPEGYEDSVREAISKAGAGCIGNYAECTFQTEGVGTFRGFEGTNPFIGTPGELEKTRENRIETILPQRILSKVIKAMIKAHPYEEVAYDVYPLLNKGQVLGIGRIGVLEQETDLNEFADHIKRVLHQDTVKVVGDTTAKIKKVAICGGSGASFISKANFMGADVLVTGDVKYHEAQSAEEIGLNIVDAGHNGTEVLIIEEMVNYLNEVMAKDKVKVFCSQVNTDPFLFL